MNLERDDLADVGAVQRTEDDHRVEPVDEFRAEVSFECFHQLLVHFIVRQLLFADLVQLESKAQGGLAADHFGADVGGHDDDGIAEVHFAPLGIREVTLFHDLEEHVERFRMGLFDFVKDHDRVRLAADGFG